MEQVRIDAALPLPGRPKGDQASEIVNPDDLRRFITDEFMIALGLPPQGGLRRLLNPILGVPAGRFARTAAEFEGRLTSSGLGAAVRWLLAQYVAPIDVRGAEHLPATGPLLVAANHPGAYDGLAIVANLGRDDVKIVISDVPFTRALPATARHAIYVAPGPYGRMAALRAMIHHLRAGGVLLIFPSGFVDPDPDLQPGAGQALESWSPSLALALRRAPGTFLVTCIVSGVLAGSCLRNPLTRLVGEPWKRRKLAEFLQLSQQLAFSRRFDIQMRVSFGRPVTAADLGQEGDARDLMPAIVANARALLEAHGTCQLLNFIT